MLISSSLLSAKAALISASWSSTRRVASAWRMEDVKGVGMVLGMQTSLRWGTLVVMHCSDTSFDKLGAAGDPCLDLGVEDSRGVPDEPWNCQGAKRMEGVNDVYDLEDVESLISLKGMKGVEEMESTDGNGSTDRMDGCASRNLGGRRAWGHAPG